MDLIIQIIPLFMLIATISMISKTVSETILMWIRERRERTARPVNMTQAQQRQVNSTHHQKRLGSRSVRGVLGLSSVLIAVSSLAFLIFTPVGEAPVTVRDIASIAQSLILFYSGLWLMRD